MKTKIGKKSVGILIAAIIVTSVFAAIAPTIGQEGEGIEPEWAPLAPWGPGLNITIDTPPEGSCVHGRINLTWVDSATGEPVALTGCVCVGLIDCEPPYCLHVWEMNFCPMGCSYWIVDLTDADWLTYIDQCEEFCVYIWNTSVIGGLPDTSRFRNGTRLTYDFVDPCIEAVDPTDGRWFNCTADLELNVSACENCENCSLASVTADLSAVTETGSWKGWPIATFSDTGKSAGRICIGEAKNCLGTYWNFTISDWQLKTSCTSSCSIVDIPVTAEDNSTDKDGHGNTQTDYLTFGVDCDDPDKVMGQDCEEVPGAIKITWTPGYDACSGVQYYNIYGIDLNASTPTQFYAGRTTGTETVFNFTGAHPKGEYCHFYQFNVSAVDNAFNEGEQSGSTEPQHLRPGPQTISISTDKSEYSPGNTMTTTIDITNPTEESVTFEWYWLVPRFSVCVPVMSSPIPAWYDETLEYSFAVPNWGATPFGNVFYVQLLDEGSSEVLDADVTWWAYSLSGAAETEPAATKTNTDFASELMKTVEGIGK